ncbi:conserved hypothetical protein [Leishmania major strain Friedlin]|uniref:Uncharacterized protein n=1 Tax=Leishmania major TaxID=5664 RepID=Q4QJ01_LEIMA|nr:conserved hypothetical protein [Leishmania major strain Friedlin]CAG9568872.1 hypothetical_protein_-_conserved [Leishmania major strain Friedlin]CAJ02122.1 conserved hypothetical protein [Leishmania major strain Friedlin]|eukprot:XP_001680847.1 conserved hypothetical protein [Leishmania major strain Friedlin]
MMFGLHHRHQPLARERLLPQPKPVQLHEFGQEVGSSPEASQSSRTFSPSCNVAAARHSACPIGSDLVSRAASDAPMHPPAPKTTLAQLTHPGHISGCPPAERPWSCTTPPGSDGATRVFLPCADNTSATTAATPSASRYPSAWQTLMAATQATAAYAASVQQAQQLLRDFEGYQRSVGASPLNHDQRRAKLTPGCLESGRGSAGTTNCPRLDVDALGQRGTPSAIISTKARGSVPSVGTGHPAQPPRASPSSSPYLSFPLDPAAYELARRRSLQALHDNAQARAACIDQGLWLSRAVHAGLLKRPGTAIGDVVTMEGSSGHLKSTAVAHNDGQALPPAAGAGHAPPTSNAAAGQQKTDQPPIAAVPVMSVAERAAATAEAERALSLLCTIRAVRRQTEELTVLLLHACGEWGCWSVPTAEEGVACETTRTPLPSSPLPGRIRHSQHLFADLFVAAPLAPTAFCTSSSVSLVGVSDGTAKADLLDLSAGEDADPARLSAASVFAKESACRRERACQALRQALQQQQQRWSLSTAAAATATLAAGAAFLEMALAPPQRAVPPPPPMSVQLDLYAVQPCALQRSIQEWRPRAAQTTAAGATKAGGTSPPEEAASLHCSLQQLLHTLGRQGPQLQSSYDVLHAAAGQRHRTNTRSCTDEQRGVPPREATTGVIKAAEARAVVHKTHGTSAAASDAPQEVEVPPLPSSSSPLAVAPDTLRRTPSSLPRQHSSTTPSSSSQALPSSDTLLSSPVQLAVDHTRLWADPPTPLQRADFSCAAAAAPTSTEISERGARIPVHQAGRSVLEDASSHRTKGKPELEAHVEVEVIGGNADGSHAAAGASSSNSTQVTNMRRTSLSSSTFFHSPVAVDARGGVVGALREVYEASWQPCSNARPSTRPEAAHAVAVAEEKLASQHQEERRSRRCDRGGSATAVELEDSVRRHLTRWISQQPKHTASDAAASLSSLALSPHDLSAAAGWLRSTSPRFAISQTAAAPPPAVVRILKHAFPDFVAPSSWNTLRAATTAAVVVEADQPDGDEEPRAPQQPQGHPPSSTITSTTPSHPYSAETSSVPEAAKLPRRSLPQAALDGPAVSHSPTSSMQSSQTPSGGNHTAAVAPPGRLLLAPVAAANPRPAPLSAPPPPPPASLPKAKPTKDGGSAGVTKLPQRQRHRSFFSRLFRCGG